jgi:hypothetical protein
VVVLVLEVILTLVVVLMVFVVIVVVVFELIVASIIEAIRAYCNEHRVTQYILLLELTSSAT